MKKTLLMLAAGLATLTASAQLYVTGGSVDGAPAAWDSQNPLAVQLENGNYTFTAQGEFKISSAKGDWNTFNAGAKCLDGSWSADKTANLKSGDANIKAPDNSSKWIYTVNEAMTTISATASSEEVQTYYGIHGDIFGVSSWSTQAMTKQADGTWTVTATIQPGNFGIKICSDPACNNQTDWNGGSASITQANQVYNVAPGSNSSTTLNGEFTIVYDPTAATIEFKGQGTPVVVTVPDALYIVGAIKGSVWSPETAPALTKDGNSFSISGVELEGSANFSFLTAQGDWDTVNASKRIGALTDGEEITLVDGQATVPARMAVGEVGAWVLAPGLYDMTVTFAEDGTISLHVVQAGEVVVVEDLVLVGSFNAWNPNDSDYLMTKNGDTYTFTFPLVEEGTAFKIKTAEDNWSTSWGAEGYEGMASDETVPVVLNEEMNSWLNSPTNFSVSESLKDMKVTFVRSNDPSVAAKITVTGTPTSGIEAVEAAADQMPAVYYNMQGIRVANPVAGQLYIVTRGATVAKEIAK